MNKSIINSYPNADTHQKIFQKQVKYTLPEAVRKLTCAPCPQTSETMRNGTPASLTLPTHLTD